MYVLSAVVWIDTLGYAPLSWFLLSYDRSFAREWINISLNYQALTLVPDHLLLFCLLLVFLRRKSAGAPA
jgi:hypothetical protein